MLGLSLRQEFRDRRLKGTAIELTNDRKTGATQIPAKDFLEITYPSLDLLKALEEIAPDRNRPVVLIGERGQGKSHLIAVLYHALNDPIATQDWLGRWSKQLAKPLIAQIKLRSGMKVISESLHRQHYKFLWDLLFDRHPDGQYIKGKWEALGENKTDIPSYELIVELLQKQPTVLILDEYQTWFDGLTNTKQYPWRTWAFNFVQILSEIAKEYPERLVLVVSVRNGTTDASQQIHRVNPVLIDFKGPQAALDRRRLLLHRLFENRLQISHPDIENLIKIHLGEYFRLAAIPPAEQERKKDDFIEAWPFAPHLMQLLEDQVLVATDAQETRDLIKILAELYKRQGQNTPILTAAHSNLEDDATEIATLLSSVSKTHQASLREKAQRNLTAVKDAVKTPSETVPHLSQIVSALWLRSLAVDNLAGASPTTLQIDITQSETIDDNGFKVELDTIIENSFNIHQIGDRLVFREEENPQAKLMAYARNDRLFTDGSDHEQLAREIRYVLGGSEEIARSFRAIVLPLTWLNDPWSSLDPTEQPDRWDNRLPIVVLPEEPDKLDQRLGTWLKEHLQKHRNTIRFLLPQVGSTNIYQDRDLLILARAILKAQEWLKESPEYKQLHKKYQTDLRGMIKQRFNRFALLQTWHYTEPQNCQFVVERIQAEGDKIPQAIEDCIRTDLFIPEDFEAFAIAAAQANNSLDKLLKELQEPRPGGQDCIPWLGETQVKEKVIRLCASGKIAIDIRGTELLQAQPGEDEETAWHRMKNRIVTGRHLEDTILSLPQAVAHSDGVEVKEPTVMVTPPSEVIYPTGATEPSQVSEPSTDPLFKPNPIGQAKSYSSPATSPLNLIGKVEAWGINPGTKVRQLSLKVDTLTGAQLQKLLRDLPEGIIYELSLDKEE